MPQFVLYLRRFLHYSMYLCLFSENLTVVFIRNAIRPQFVAFLEGTISILSSIGPSNDSEYCTTKQSPGAARRPKSPFNQSRKPEKKITILSAARDLTRQAKSAGRRK